MHLRYACDVLSTRKTKECKKYVHRRDLQTKGTSDEKATTGDEEEKKTEVPYVNVVYSSIIDS